MSIENVNIGSKVCQPNDFVTWNKWSDYKMGQWQWYNRQFDHCVNVLQNKQKKRRPTKASNNAVNGTWHTYNRPPWTYHKNILKVKAIFLWDIFYSSFDLLQNCLTFKFRVSLNCCWSIDMFVFFFSIHTHNWISNCSSHIYANTQMNSDTVGKSVFCITHKNHRWDLRCVWKNVHTHTQTHSTFLFGKCVRFKQSIKCNYSILLFNIIVIHRLCFFLCVSCFVHSIP